MTDGPDTAPGGAIAFADVSFAVDTERRTIRGLAVPYGKIGWSEGRQFRFSQGTLKWSDVSRVKLFGLHDPLEAVGAAFELDDRPEGLYAAFQVAPGKKGDKALRNAKSRVWDGLSIRPRPYESKFSLSKDGVMEAVSCPLLEISLTPAPSFDDARVHSVTAFSVDQEGTPTMADKQATATEVPPTYEAPAAPAFDVSTLTDPLTDAIKAGFAGLVYPQREAVPAAAGTTVVREELPYRFNGPAGQFSFLDDLRDSSSGNAVATQRLGEFMDEVFAVTTTGTAALNPTENRPELYVPNLTFTRPLFELCSTGAIDNKTPFTVPKFSAAAGLVAAHTEGVEPTPGSFSATSQTVSPGPSSGKIEVNREVWDQGGSPQVDPIIWGEMLNGWFEAIEAKIAATLNALSLTETNLASAVDGPLNIAMTGLLADLQFVRGGNRYTAFAADGNLFKALVQAKDTAGRPLYPTDGPVNTDGATSGGFDRVRIGNLVVRAAWALNVGVANAWNSYLFVPGSVWCWVSPPRRFTFEYQIKSIDMAIWGYTGTAVLRDTDVKRIDYTTADV